MSYRKGTPKLPGIAGFPLKPKEGTIVKNTRGGLKEMEALGLRTPIPFICPQQTTSAAKGPLSSWTHRIYLVDSQGACIRWDRLGQSSLIVEAGRSNLTLDSNTLQGVNALKTSSLLPILRSLPPRTAMLHDCNFMLHPILL